MKKSAGIPIIAAMTLFLTLFFLVSGRLLAEVPSQINYQGKLTTPTGERVADGTYSMVFKLYQDDTTLVWTETFDGGDAIQVTNGVFNVILGSGDNDGDLREIFKDYDNLYLGMTVEDEDEMTPRRRIGSRGYALTAETTAADNPVGTIKIYIDSDPPDGWLACDGAEVLRDTYADLFAVVGTNYGAGDGSTTFNLPDLRGRFPIGKSGSRTLGSTGGSETIDLAHSHTVSSHSHSISTATCAHSHSYSASFGGGAHQHRIQKDLYNHIGDTSDNVSDSDSDATVLSNDHGHRLDFWTPSGQGGHSHSKSASTNSSSLSHNHGGSSGSASPGTDSQLSSSQSIMPPYQVVSYVIKY